MSIDGSIIIIDDDEDDHYFYKRVLDKLGIKRNLVFFTDAEKALKYLHSKTVKPFIILCDINMPRMGGLELRKRIHEDEVLRKKSIPFIFFSTSAMSTIVNDAFDLTVQGFFIKEQSFEKMENTLRVIFEYWNKCEHPNRFE